MMLSGGRLNAQTPFKSLLNAYFLLSIKQGKPRINVEEVSRAKIAQFFKSFQVYFERKGEGASSYACHELSFGVILSYVQKSHL